MKRFLFHTLFLAIPIVLLFLISEFLIRNIPNDYSYKNNYLELNASGIETLFLGSSHAYYGIDPENFTGNSFNASHISQSIDLDYMILHKFSKKLKNLKNLVVPVDYLTLFYRTSTGVESWRMKNYNLYYNLSTSLNPKQNFEVLSIDFKKNTNRIIDYFIKEQNPLTCSELGYGIITRKKEDLVKTGITAAQRHTITNRKYLKESIAYLDKIIAFSEENNITVLFYTSPAYSTYRENLDQEQLNITLLTMDSICNQHNNTFYLNLLSDTNFTVNDFRDADHLNISGSIKLTNIIDHQILNFRHPRESN